MAIIDDKVVTVASLKAVHNYNKEIYMTEYKPTGSGSLSLNRRDGSTVGLNSVAIGDNVAATGDFSHAEGKDNNASGNASHAEGIGTTASGMAASHAEGFETTASGATSHAEGQYGTASGEASHVEGYETLASSQYQHVQGKYNIEDTNDVYAHIVGNGTSSERSNAHTLDWDGNAWYAGDLSADGNIILSSNQYGDELPAAGNVGRIFFKRLVE